MGHSGNLPAGAARTTLDCRAAGLDLKAGFQRWPTAWRSTASVRPICCSSSRTCSPTASTFRRRSGSAERSRRRRPHRCGGSAPGGARWHGPARCRPHAAPRASHERSSSGSSRGPAREVVPGTTAAARVPAAPNATPTAKPSRMLCSVMARTSSVAVDQGVRRPSAAAGGRSGWRCGRSRSASPRNAAPFGWPCGGRKPGGLPPRLSDGDRGIEKGPARGCQHDPRWRSRASR
jgi:hypothetical protein